MPGGKAITERGCACYRCRTFQSPKKRADAQGKSDPSLMSPRLSRCLPKPQLSPQISPSCPLTLPQYKSGSTAFHLESFPSLCQSHGSSCHSTAASPHLVNGTSWANSQEMLTCCDGFDGSFVWHARCNAMRCGQ